MISFQNSTRRLPFGLVLLLTAGVMTNIGSAQEAAKKEWAIVVHGGAGSALKGAPEDRVADYRKGLSEALDAGQKVLTEGGTSLEAVEATIIRLEDNPLFNAGRGAVFNATGGHELDASIMDGNTLDGGAVAGVTTVKNPITLARLVMQQTRHVLLSGAGVEQFAGEMKVERVENDYFSTEQQRASWERVRTRDQQSEFQRIETPKPWHYGTVGCVALDKHGNLAAGTSTGGLTNKKFGRVGDSPVIGAGTYAKNTTCGVSASGIGEQFIRHAAAAQISLLMEHRDWSLEAAAEHVIGKALRPGDGGVIAIDHKGEIVWEFSTPGMFRAAADSAGMREVLVGDERR